MKYVTALRLKNKIQIQFNLWTKDVLVEVVSLLVNKLPNTRGSLSFGFDIVYLLFPYFAKVQL